MDEFYFKIGQLHDYEKKPMFADSSSFTISVLSLPHSIAICERQFSKINLIKTDSRNRLLTKTINGIMHSSQSMHLANGCVNFQPSEIMLKSMTTSANVSDQQNDPEINIIFDI